MHDEAWQKIYEFEKIGKHKFAERPLILTAEQIKRATAHFKKTGDREVRILCYQDTRNALPAVFKENGLFLLPIKNGTFAIMQGEGYVDIPPIKSAVQTYHSKLDFDLQSSQVGNSEMQHLDFAYASSLVRSFLDDSSLVLTIRGRKRTKQFDFVAGKYRQPLTAEGVQIEVDAGYEGKSQIVLVEAKNKDTENTIIRQLYYPFRHWQTATDKKVKLLFFEKRNHIYSLWHFKFADENDYNSIILADSARYEIR